MLSWISVNCTLFSIDYKSYDATTNDRLSLIVLTNKMFLFFIFGVTLRFLGKGPPDTSEFGGAR
jgi:hypothetical protein